MPTVYNKVTANGNAIIDLSQDTVTQASHIVAGFVGHLADGTQVTGTGGGSGGLEYETGTYTPASDVENPTISFTNTHTSRPFIAFIVDTAETTIPSSSASAHAAYLTYEIIGKKIGGDANIYGRAQYFNQSTNSTSASGTNITSSNVGNYITTTGFTPRNGSNYKFKSGRSYRWVAVWPPSSY